MTTENIDGVLENWLISDIGWPAVVGDLYGDRKGRFLEGERVHTSTVEEIDTGEPREGSPVTTRNSLYRLGKPFTPAPPDDTKPR